MIEVVVMDEPEFGGTSGKNSGSGPTEADGSPRSPGETLER